jgi:hypothetical protein
MQEFQKCTCVCILDSFFPRFSLQPLFPMFFFIQFIVLIIAVAGALCETISVCIDLPYSAGFGVP